MSKELEAFHKIIETYGNTNSLEGTYDNFLTIKKALQHLEAIENAKPNEALECLKSLDIQTRFIGILDVPNWEKSLPIIKQALLKTQEQEKVLKIIKEKPYESAPTINYIKINKDNPKMLNYEHYCMTIKQKVNENEFDLVKKVFSNFL